MAGDWIAVVDRRCFGCGQDIRCRDGHVVRCHECQERREAKMKRDYARSPRGKMKRGEWYERNRERLLSQMREAHRRRMAARGPRMVPCALQPCDRYVMRVHRSKRRYCPACFSALHGPSRARQRARSPEGMVMRGEVVILPFKRRGLAADRHAAQPHPR